MIKLNNTINDLGNSDFPTMHNAYGYLREVSPTIELMAAGSQSIDCSLYSVFRKTGGNATLNFINMQENQQINIAIESIGSSYTLIFSGETFKWSGGEQPTPTETAEKVDIYSFIKIGSVVYSNALQEF